MAKDLSTTGHVALYGIHFDKDKADPKPESQPTLQEIAKLLKQDASLKLYIAGRARRTQGRAATTKRVIAPSCLTGFRRTKTRSL